MSSSSEAKQGTTERKAVTIAESSPPPLVAPNAAASSRPRSCRRFSEAVEKVLQDVCPSDDPVDRPDFDPVAYLNERFPDDASLKSLPTFYEEVKTKLHRAETDLLDTVKTQATTATEAAQDLTDAQTAVLKLHGRVTEIKTKASESEERVRNLCFHIRQLDAAKTNLSESVKTLKKLHLWMLQIQRLQDAFEKRNFTDCRVLLADALSHSAYFERFKDVPKIKELRERVANTCKQLGWHIQNLFVVESAVPDDTLREACLAADVMGPEVWKAIVQKFVKKELEVYTLKFKRGTEDAKFEKTERRYVHIRTLLDRDEAMIDYVFPPRWCVLQEVCLEFCLRTKPELTFALRESAGNIDVAVLIYILQKTIEIEKDLSHRAKKKTLMAIEAAQEQQSQHRGGGEAPPPPQFPDFKFNNFLLQCFDDHMGLYVQQERDLMHSIVPDVIPEAEFAVAQEDTNLAAVMGGVGTVQPAPKAGAVPTGAPGAGGGTGTPSLGSNARMGTTLSSSDDIFVLIKESLKRASSLSRRQTLVEVAGVWLSELSRYADVLSAASAQPPVLPFAERKLCCVVNTAEKCRTTAEELAMALLGGGDTGGRLDMLPGPAVDTRPLMQEFEAVVDRFANVYAKSILTLVSGIEKESLDALSEFTSGSFIAAIARDAGAQDRSPYVTKVRRVLETRVYNCCSLLDRSALRYFLDKVAVRIVPLYTKGIYRLRGLNDATVNQLRLDCRALEGTFLKLPNVGDPNRFAATALTGYNKRVTREFERMDRTLKVLQCDLSNHLVDFYLSVMPEEDRTVQHFGLILELKGLKGEELRPWLTLMRSKSVPDGNGEVMPPPLPAARSSAASSSATVTSPTSNGQSRQATSGVVPSTSYSSYDIRDGIDKLKSGIDRSIVSKLQFLKTGSSKKE